MTATITFDDIREPFTPDGSWRDIYALNTTSEQWLSFLKMVFSAPWPTELSVNGSPSRQPEEAVRVFHEADVYADMRITVAGAGLNCYFFTDVQIELDLDPKEIGDHNFGELCLFIEAMGQATGRNIYVTEESATYAGIFAYKLDTRTFDRLHRPAERTEFGRKLRDRVRETLAHLVALQPSKGKTAPWPLADRHGDTPIPQGADAKESARRWHALYAPDDLRWHTELTESEFIALDHFDTALGIFFGPRTPEELCRIGGFKIRNLQNQFWDSLAHIAREFDLRS